MIAALWIGSLVLAFVKGAVIAYFIGYHRGALDTVNQQIIKLDRFLDRDGEGGVSRR